jgi:hypothetical protein
MNSNERKTVLFHVIAALNNYSKAKLEPDIYANQIPARAAIVIALRGLMEELGINKSELNGGVLLCNINDIDNAYNDAQKAFD